MKGWPVGMEEGHMQRLSNSDTITDKVCNQLFSTRWKSGHYTLCATTII